MSSVARDLLANDRLRPIVVSVLWGTLTATYENPGGDCARNNGELSDLGAPIGVPLLKEARSAAAAPAAANLLVVSHTNERSLHR